MSPGPRMFASERLFRNLDIMYIFPRPKKLDIRMTQQYFVEATRLGEADRYDVWVGPEMLETCEWLDSAVTSILRAPNDEADVAAGDSFPGGARIGDAATPRDVTAAIFDGEKCGHEL